MMHFSREKLRQIDSARYLTTENTWRYRAIIHILYEQYEQMRYWTEQTALYELLKAYEEFAQYTPEQLRSDLDRLVAWENVLAIADMSNVRTVEAFKNRAFQYQLTPATIALERTLLQLERETIESQATLETSLVVRFAQILGQFDALPNQDGQACYNWWRELNSAFRELNRNYQDYIARFYSPKAEELMQTTAFLLYKESFITYLRHFVKKLQATSGEVIALFARITDADLQTVIDKMLAYGKSLVQLEALSDDDTYYRQVFANMRRWFGGDDDNLSQVERLIERTGEIIRRLTFYAAQIADRRLSTSNRKEEYRHLQKLFRQCVDLDEAHRLAAMTLGAGGTAHLRGDCQRQTESTNSGIYDEPPHVAELVPRTRHFKEPLLKTNAIDRSAEKRQKRAALLARREAELAHLEKFKRQGCIDFAQVGQLTPKERALLLRCLEKGRQVPLGVFQGQGAERFRVERLAGEVTLICTDGRLVMPHYRLIFEEDC